MWATSYRPEPQTSVCFCYPMEYFKVNSCHSMNLVPSQQLKIYFVSVTLIATVIQFDLRFFSVMNEIFSANK